MIYNNLLEADSPFQLSSIDSPYFDHATNCYGKSDLHVDLDTHYVDNHNRLRTIRPEISYENIEIGDTTFSSLRWEEVAVIFGDGEEGDSVYKPLPKDEQPESDVLESSVFSYRADTDVLSVFIK